MVKINFADIEEQEKLPKGRYHFAVTDVDLKEGTAKKPEAEWWNAEATVQDGEFEGRKEFLFIGLPAYNEDGTVDEKRHYEPFTLVQLLRATVGQHDWTAEEVEDGEADIEMDDLIGLEFIGNVRPQKNNPDFNQVGIKRFDPDEWSTNDLLPE